MISYICLSLITYHLSLSTYYLIISDIPGRKPSNFSVGRALTSKVFRSYCPLALVASSNEAAARFADRIVYDGKTGEKLMEAQRRNMPTDGAERIAEYVLKQAAKERQ